MSTINTLPSSGERLSFFKLFSEKNYTVEIPIIQRDYAQGRASEYEVRESFLEALNQYLIQNIPNRDLDFVYGSLTEDGASFKFVPLDGQQRLTTLFLLHWYLAQISNQAEVLRSVLYKNNKKSLFRYETRSSSSEFCDALVGNDIDMSRLLEVGVDGKGSLSKTLQDYGWFHLSWMSDPTIQSMLNMLDSIHTKFSGNPEFFQRLIDEENPVITFLFLDLKEFNLSDDLYIKMNARGKPLTDFENFKAKLEQRIKSFRNELSGYSLNFSGDKSVDGYQYFVHKIDTDWADLFWGYRNESSKDNTFDDELMNFIRLIIANHCLLSKSESNGQSDSLNKLLGSGGKLNPLSFIEYGDLECLSSDFVAHLIQMMDLLYGEGPSGDRIKPYLDNDYYYSEEEIFKKVIANNTNYQEKLRFFAFYSYLSSGKEQAGLMEWLRVIYNLTENTIINNSDEYLNRFLSIQALSQKDESILDALRSDCDVAGFHPSQVLEEKIKAHLIAKSVEWKSLIVDVEKHPFFDGQIGFVLNFAGILDFYRKNKNCEWGAESEEKYYSDFKIYAEQGSEVFNLIKDDSYKIDYLWERAVLSKGMYFTEASYNRWNLLNTRLSKNNIDRDHSWKRLLRISVNGQDEWEKRQNYVKAVFDDQNFDIKNVESSLRHICDKALNDPAVEDWKKAFIQYKELFAYCKQGFIMKNEDKILLLSESQRNHYHSELSSRIFYLEAKPKFEQLTPFKNLKYYAVKSSEDASSTRLDQWTYKGKEYAINIQFHDFKYVLDFYPYNFDVCSEDLVGFLEPYGFELTTEDHDSFYRTSINSSVEAFEVMKGLCSDLRGLDSE